MLSVTKIFRFEMAHALYGYQGACSNIHGHSYVLHVTVQEGGNRDSYLPPPGFMVDFKQLKHIVIQEVISEMDHMLYLSAEAVKNFGIGKEYKNLHVTNWEPSAENLLHFIRLRLSKAMPEHIVLKALKLYETSDSYVEWRMN